MRGFRCTDSQIAEALKRVEAGLVVPELYRENQGPVRQVRIQEFGSDSSKASQQSHRTTQRFTGIIHRKLEHFCRD